MAEAETKAVLAAEKDPTPNLPAVLGGYKIAKLAPEKLGAVITANVAGGISVFDLDRVKVPSGGGIAWMVPGLDGMKSATEVTGVIVAWQDQRAYWKGSYSGEGSPPDCSSADSLTGVGDPGVACRSCALAQFGSAEKFNEKTKQMESTAGQACKQVRILLLIRPEDMLPIVVACPPTSLKAIKQYFLRLAGQGIPYWGAVTKLTLAEDKNAGGIKYSKVEPRLVAQLPDSEADRIYAYHQAIAGVLNTIDAEGVAQAG